MPVNSVPAVTLPRSSPSPAGSQGTKNFSVQGRPNTSKKASKAAVAADFYCLTWWLMSTLNWLMGLPMVLVGSVQEVAGSG
eukprot:scaffold100046_cov15-Tisochrysis_lutea.AAC.1